MKTDKEQSQFNVYVAWKLAKLANSSVAYADLPTYEEFKKLHKNKPKRGRRRKLKNPTENELMGGL